MELYAAGFNAWNQLLFPPLPPQCETEPDDLHVFTKVLTGGDIERPRATLSYTTGMSIGRLVLFRMPR